MVVRRGAVDVGGKMEEGRTRGGARVGRASHLGLEQKQTKVFGYL